MKKLTGLFILVFCLNLQMMAQVKKPRPQPATPPMPDIEKMLKDLPADQRAAVEAIIAKQKSGGNKKEAAKNTTALDDWNKAQKEAAAAIGTITTKTIGVEGGIVKSNNGKITLNIPAGALTANTTIGIEEMENTAPLSCGNSFKLTPDGLTFSKPVSLTLKYSDVDIDGTMTEALSIATQSDGIWVANQKAEVNIETNTISLPIKHFSDWGMIAFLKVLMIPGDKELGRGQSIDFRITTYKDVTDKKKSRDEEFKKGADEVDKEADLTAKELKEYLDGFNDDDLVPLTKEAPKTKERHKAEAAAKQTADLAATSEEDLVPLVPPKTPLEQAIDDRLLELLKRLNKFKGLKITAWKVNGVAAPVSNEMGSLRSSEYGVATYKAPQVVPLDNVRWVAISCEMKSMQSGAKFILISHVLLTSNGWFKANIDGEPWFAHELYDQKNIAAIQGKTAGEIKSASAVYIEEPVEDKGLIISLTNGFPKSIVLRILDPHLGANIIDCNSDGAALMMGDWGGVLTSYRRQMNGGTCETIEEICNKLTVNLTALNLKNGGLVEGNFGGSLFGGEKGCVNSLEHKVAGSFSLSVVKQTSAKEFLEKNNIKDPKNND